MTTTTAVKCRAKNPATCPFHGRKINRLEREALNLQRRLRELDAQNKQKQLHEFRVADLDRNLNMVVKNGITTVSVYRSGVVEPPKERGVEKEVYQLADAVKPQGQQGRTTGIFAAPSLNAATRWVRGNFFTNVPDVKVRELRVNPDKVYVYYIPFWERASNALDYRDSNGVEAAQRFWDSGIKLTDWINKFRNDPTMEPDEWELILSPDDISQVKPVSSTRALASVPDDAYSKTELERIFKTK